MPTQRVIGKRKLTAGKTVKPAVNKNESRGGNEDTQWYRQKRWRDFRAAQLADEPFCRHCAARGKQTIATVVDHIKAVKDGGGKYDKKNVQSLCDPCHNRKSSSERRNIYKARNQ